MVALRYLSDCLPSHLPRSLSSRRYCQHPGCQARGLPVSKLYLTDRLAEGQPAIHQAQVSEPHTISSLALGGRHIVNDIFGLSSFYIEAEIYRLSYRGASIEQRPRSAKAPRTGCQRLWRARLELSETLGCLGYRPSPVFVARRDRRTKLLGGSRGRGRKRRDRGSRSEGEIDESLCRCRDGWQQAGMIGPDGSPPTTALGRINVDVVEAARWLFVSAATCDSTASLVYSRHSS